MTTLMLDASAPVAGDTTGMPPRDDIELLHSISVELIGEQDINALYKKILNAAVTIAASQFGSMQVLHADRGPVGGLGELKLLVAHGYSAAAEKQFEWVNARSRTSCGVSLITKTRTVIADVEQFDLLTGSQELAAFREAGIRSMQTTPLISRSGKILGMISTHWTKPHQPSQRDLRLMDILARQAADLLERTSAEAARRQAGETQRLLLNELNHRVKNTLATVQSIVQMTMRHTSDPASFAKAFAGRVQSLARVHSVLTDATWQGADLRALIDDQLLSGVMETRQLRIEGPDVHLPPQMAMHLALMLHELGTNAAKYGALLDPNGLVSLRWLVADGTLKMHWKESGGPRVVAPVRRGFGTTLIEGTARSDGGSAQAVFEADGISWQIAFPLPEDFASAPSAFTSVQVLEQAARVEVAAPDGPLTGLRILIVEDEPLVAMNSEAILEDAGATIARSVGNVKDALEAVVDADFDVAILDANLYGKPVDEIAAALTRRDVPFLFVSGHGREGLPRAFAHAPALAKPYALDDLVLAVKNLKERPQGVAALRKHASGMRAG